MNCKDGDCSCLKRSETWEQESGRWVCKASGCSHYLEGGGCKLGKVSLTCDNNACRWNKKVEGYGIYVCSCMDIHLDANGQCYGKQKKGE